MLNVAACPRVSAGRSARSVMVGRGAAGAAATAAGGADAAGGAAATLRLHANDPNAANTRRTVISVIDRMCVIASSRSLAYMPAFRAAIRQTPEFQKEKTLYRFDNGGAWQTWPNNRFPECSGEENELCRSVARESSLR